MTEQEQLIAKIFDNSVNALGLMAKKIAESIEKEPSEQALRDDFAKAAMQGLISNTNNLSYLPGNSGRGLVLDEISKDAYDIAHAMMQERERRMKG